MIFKAKLSENDVKRIIEVCKRSNISWDQLLKMCLDFISNPKDQNPIISWSENQELDKKFKEYLLARNAQANAWSSNIKKELEIQIKALKI
jgi:molybdenum cofactor biosynthesis enzyme MoaA